MTFSRSGQSVQATVRLVVLAALLATGGCSTKPQRLYRRAEAFFAQGQYELAARDYARIVQEAPRDALADDALYKLAYLYREELGNPLAALQVYRRLADDYENSNYVDDALFWMVYLQRRHLEDPDLVVATCREIDERFSADKDLRGRAHLEAAGAYADAGRLTDARGHYTRISEQFSTRPSIAAQALLMLANIAHKAAEDPTESRALYERVVELYPNTQAAVAAREALGWLYYDDKTQADKASLDALRKQARVLSDVPPIEANAGQPAMELLAAMRSLLRQAGVEVSLDQLVVTSGLSFTFSFSLEHPQSAQAFYRNPLANIAEQMGFGYNLWTSAAGGNVLESATGCLANNRPLVIAYGSPTAHWCMITGHRPADKELYLLKPGASGAMKLSPDEFLRVWRASQVPSLWPQGSVAGLQFALTRRQSEPDLAATVKSAVLQASLAWDEKELMRQPAGGAAYDALLEALESAAQDQDVEAREQIKSWAEQAIPLILSSRRAAVRFFAQPPAELPEEQGVGFVAASKRYEQIVNQWEALAEELAQAPVQPEQVDDSRLTENLLQQWRRAVALAEDIAELEVQALHELASSLAE